MSIRVHRIALLGVLTGAVCVGAGATPFVGGLVQEVQAAQAAPAKRTCPPPKVVIQGKCDCPQNKCYTSGPCGPSYWMNKRRRPC